jgi:hypothetical protein
MDGSASGGGKVFGHLTEEAHRVLDRSREEAERFGHRYVGPEHVLLGLLVEGRSGAAWALRVRGVDLAAAWAALARLGHWGVVPGPRPSDVELLSSLGIDLDIVRYQTEQTFGLDAVGEATWRVTRRRWWRGARVGVDAAVRPAVGCQASHAAGQRAGACPERPRGQTRAPVTGGLCGCAAARGHGAGVASAPADRRSCRAARGLPGSGRAAARCRSSPFERARPRTASSLRLARGQPRRVEVTL